MNSVISSILSTLPDSDLFHLRNLNLFIYHEVEKLDRERQAYSIEFNFIGACFSGHLNLVKRLTIEEIIKLRVRMKSKPSGLPKEMRDLHEGFALACESNQLEVAKWLKEVLTKLNDDKSIRTRNLYEDFDGRQHREAIMMNKQAFSGACKEGHLQIAKWLMSEGIGDLTEGFIRICLCWPNRIGENQIKTARWLVEEGADKCHCRKTVEEHFQYWEKLQNKH